MTTSHYGYIVKKIINKETIKQKRMHAPEYHQKIVLLFV